MRRTKLIAMMAAVALVLGFVAIQSKPAGTSTASTPMTNGGGIGDVIVTRDATLGQKYGTPGPRRCTTAAPAGDALTAEQATTYFTCGLEGETGDGEGVYLAANVTAQLGQPRPYAYASDAMDRSIDPSKPVYDIRGSALQYTCVAPGSSMASIWGAQCHVGPSNNLVGVCYKTTFGEWRCLANDSSHDRTAETASAPPQS